MEQSAEHKHNKRRRRWIIIGVIVLVLLIVRLILPTVILKYMNKTLTNLKEFSGHVDDIDLAIIRGAYKINGIHIYKKDSVSKKTDSIPFFESPSLDLSVQWKALFKGKVVGEIYVDDPVVNFVKGQHK